MAGELIYSSNTNNTGNISTLQCAELEVSVLVTNPPFTGGSLRVYIDDIEVDSVSISSSNNTYSNSFTSGGNIRVELTASFGSTSGDIEIFCVFPPKDLFKLGDIKPKNIALGDKNVVEIRKGDNLVWEGLVSPGQVEFTEPGTYQWTVPKRVKRVSAVAVGAGGGGIFNYGTPSSTSYSGGSGGGLAYATFNVTPGQVLNIRVGEGGKGTYGQPAPPGGESFVQEGDTYKVRASGGSGAVNGGNAPGGTNLVGSGGTGGTSEAGDGDTIYARPGGGGAAGYSGNGGKGVWGQYRSGGNGSGGGGGGGAFEGGGGGVGIYGQGSNGSGGSTSSNQGKGGSSGGPGIKGGGGLFGGGQSADSSTSNPGGNGAVRIIWGNKEVVREYPSTNTEDY